MDQKTEKEQPKAEVVTLDQEFTLFPIEKTKPNSSHPSGTEQLSRQIILETSGQANLPITLDATYYGEGTNALTETLTPLKQDSGYVITTEDFDPQNRKSKIEALKMEKVDLSKNPLVILAGTSGEAFQKMGLAEKVPDIHPESYDLKPGLEPILKGLRFQIFFPNGLSFQAQPDETSLSDGILQFGDFYPLDTPPLANVEREGSPSIFIPSDIHLLSQIKARFIFKENPDQQKSVTESSK